MDIEFACFSGGLALFASACVSLVLGLLFRLKCRRLNGVTQNVSISVFHRKFNIFNPFAAERRMISSFLMAIPFVALAGTALAFLMFAQILASGLLLATILALVSLNLLLVEGASEVYHNATLFAQAIAKGAGFGEGDFTTLRIVENALAKMSSYYFGLAAALTIFGFSLPSVVPLLLSSLASMIDLLFRIGWGFGFPPVVTPLFWTIIMLGATVLIRAFKNRFSHSVFSYPS